MKGQFMIISSVIIALILITTASTVSEIQYREFHQDSTDYVLNMVNTEADKVDKASAEERENYRRLIDMMQEYSTTTVFWQQENCFNITLVRPGDRYQMNCIG